MEALNDNDAISADQVAGYLRENRDFFHLLNSYFLSLEAMLKP